MKNIHYILLIFFFACISHAKSQNDSYNIEDENIALDTAVRHGKLENGFTYYLQRNDTPKNMIELHMVVKAGNYHEDDDQLSYAHLLEHVGLFGTKHFPDVNYFRRSGRYSQAQTLSDFTKYFVRIPSGDKEVLRNSLQLARDWAQDINLDQESIDVQRGALLGEMRYSNPYQRWLSDTIHEEILKGTGYKPHDRTKHKASIENFNRNAFLRYYKDWYRPDLQGIIAVGDINLDSVEVEVKRLFSNLEMPNQPKNAQEPLDARSVELDGKNRYATVLDTIRPDFRLYMVSKRINREYDKKTRTDYREMLLQQLYTEMIGNRGKHLERQYNPPFSEFTANYRANQLGGGQIYATWISVDLASDDPGHVKKQVVDALVEWKRIHVGFTDSDLERAKDRIRRNYPHNQPINSSELAWRYSHHFVRGVAAPTPAVESSMISEILEQIDLQEVQEFISEYGNLMNNNNFLFFKGEQFAVPDYSMFRKWIEVVHNTKVEPLTPPQYITSLADVAKVPLKEGVESKNISENIIGVTTVVLNNGVKLMLKPTKPATDRYEQTVSIHAYRPNMAPMDNREKYLAAKNAPELVRFTGAGPYTKFELEKFMLDKGIRLRLEADQEAQTINGEFKMADIKEFLNLLYLYITDPREDSEGFRAWKAYQVDQFNGHSLKRGSSEFYMDNVRARWFPQVPNLELQDLEELSMEEMFRAYKKWYSDITGYTFMVTGDFDQDVVLPILVDNLSAFPVMEAPTHNTIDLEFPLKKMDETIRLPNINQAYVRLYFPILVAKDVQTTVSLQLLSKALHSRVWPQLRKGSYSPGAGGDWIDVEKGIYGFWIDFDSELGNEENLIKMAMEEFRELRRNGVEQSWLETTIEDERINYGKNLDSFWILNFWPEYLSRKASSGEDPKKEVLMYKTVMEHYTSLEDINAAAEKYLSEENLQQFLVIPEWYEKANSVK